MPNNNPTALQMELSEQQGIIDQSLSKAAGVLFVMQQVRDAELIDEEMTGLAIWAVRDFVNDARQAFYRLQDLEQETATTAEEVSHA